MKQIVFLDTNILLDYLENRYEKVKNIVSLLLQFHKQKKIILATSIFNIAELLDKEVDIYFFGELLKKRLSYDEIVKKKNDSKMRRNVAVKYVDKLKKKIEKFIFENNIYVFSLGSEEDSNLYDDLYNLIFNCGLSSQDAFIVSTTLLNQCAYFLSNDSNLVNILNDEGLIDAYNLKNENHRKEFEKTVLEALMEVLE